MIKISLQLFGGSGQALGRSGSTIRNTIPYIGDDAERALSTLLRDKEDIIRSAPVRDVSLTNVKTTQQTLEEARLARAMSTPSRGDLPVIVGTAQGNIIVDGNHRVIAALSDGKTSIRAHYVKASDLNLSAEELRRLYRRRG